MKKNTFILLLAVLFVAACTPKISEQLPQKENAPDKEVTWKKTKPVEPPRSGAFEKDTKPVEPVVIARLKRMPCYGKCPSFELKIYDDGMVKYHGMAHVDRLGYYAGHAGKEAIVNIQSKAEEIGFFSLAGQYPRAGAPQIYDMPETTTFIQIDGQAHTIKNRHDSPPALYKLEQFIEAQLADVSWTIIPYGEFNQ